MFSALTRKGFELAKDATIAPALQEQIKLMAMQLEFSEKKLADLEKDKIRLEVKNENLEKELAKVKEELTKLDGKAKLVEIGACSIKIDQHGRQLPGEYCSRCGQVLVNFNDQAACHICHYYIEKTVIQNHIRLFKQQSTTPQN